jgi:CRP-like cAMP-binding protein
MATKTIVASLSRIPVFAVLRPPQIARIARRAEQRRFRRGDVITRAGTLGDRAYLILSGEVQCWPRRGSLSEPIAPGSLVGELAMLVDHIYGATVVADGPVDCLELTRTVLHRQMRADPDIAERLARVIRERLTLTASELRRIDQLLSQSSSVIARIGVGRPLLAPPAAVRVPGYRQ